MTRARRRTKAVVVVVVVERGGQCKDNSAEAGATEEGGRTEDGEITPRAKCLPKVQWGASVPHDWQYPGPFEAPVEGKEGTWVFERGLRECLGGCVVQMRKTRGRSIIQLRAPESGCGA